MSGPEWTDDEPETRDHSRPMSHEAGHDHDHDLNEEIDHVPSLDRSPEPLMERDHDSDSADRDDEPAPEAEAETETEAESAPKRPSFVATALAMLAKIPRPSLGSERHEVFPDEPHLPPQPVASAEPTLPPARPRLTGRFPGLAMRRETRVGIAALLSFVILVGALIAKRSWGGKPTPALALAGPLGDEPAPTVPEVGKHEEGAKPESPKVDKDREKKEPGSAPITKSTEPPPVDPAGSKPRLPSETTGPADPVALPPTTESTTPAVLPSTLPTDSAVLPPDANTPKPPAPPAGPVDPLPIPGGVEMPSATPPSLPPPGASAELPPTPSPSNESKPKETEINPPSAPAPTPAASSLGEPPSLTPIVEPSQPPPVVAEPAAPPAVTQAPPPAEAPSRPIPTEKPPAFESVSSVEASTTRASTAGSLGAGWVMIPSGGRRIVGAVPIVSTPAEAQVEPPRVADGPKFADDPASVDQVEPFVHEVRPGENFWTISKLYYRSGRFYKALHAANRKQVPDIRQLWVGTVLRIPPPEALDRSLIDPPSRSGGDEASTSIVSRTSKRLEPPDEADLAMPVRPRRVAPDPEAVEAPRRPTYKVKAHETLRSIARDTLNDPKRDREIYNLNRDVLDDINVLPAGTVLTLPTDATSSRGVK